MVSVNELYSYFGQMPQRIAAVKDCLMVFNQENLADAIKNQSKWPAIVVVMPGAKSDGADEDNVSDASECLVFVIEKLDLKNLGKGEMTSKMDYLQGHMETLKSLMLEDMHAHEEPNHLMHYLEPDGMTTEPEYNYLGCYGWSLAFRINSPGFNAR